MSITRTTYSGRLAAAVLVAVAASWACGAVGCRKHTDISGYEEIGERIPETELRAERVRTFEAKVGELRGIAIDADDRIYLVGSLGVRVLNGEGAEVATWKTPEDARAIAVADDGSVYVALTTRILTFDRNGKPLGAWGAEGTRPGELGHVTSLAVRGSDVVVADWGKLCLQRFDTTGRFINLIGKRDRTKDFIGILAPSAYLDLAIDRDGRVVVGNPGRLRVETYSLSGELLGAWGKPGYQPERFSPCCNPTNLALTRDGNIVTAEKGLPRVKVYDPTGKLLAYISQRDYFPKEAKGMDLAADSKGRIYVLEPFGGVVMVFEIGRPPG